MPAVELRSDGVVVIAMSLGIVMVSVIFGVCSTAEYGDIGKSQVHCNVSSYHK